MMSVISGHDFVQPMSNLVKAKFNFVLTVAKTYICSMKIERSIFVCGYKMYNTVWACNNMYNTVLKIF